MKFCVILGNPPYSKKVGRNNVNLWKELTLKAVDMLADDGFLAFIHPSGWRGGGNTFKNNFKVMVHDNQMHYLEMHGIADGKKMFNCSTTYDWYVVQNTPPYTTTTVTDWDGLTQEISFEHRDFLASGMIAEIDSLFSFNAENIELAPRTTYSTQSSNTSKTKSSLPLVNNVRKDGALNLYYTTKDVGQFNQPKLILSSGAAGNTFLDADGKYGVTEFSMALFDTVDNLKKIQQSLGNPKLKRILKRVETRESEPYSRNILAKFPKNFYKDFS